jgi:hypothetical protein
MKTYYFHLRDGTDTLLDADGRVLPNIGSVIALALAEARAIIGADALEGRIELAQRIDVEDEQGTLVHRLEFEDAVQITRHQQSKTS